MEGKLTKRFRATGLGELVVGGARLEDEHEKEDRSGAEEGDLLSGHSGHPGGSVEQGDGYARLKWRCVCFMCGDGRGWVDWCGWAVRREGQSQSPGNPL